MSQLVNEAYQLPLWKQEVRRRIAAHKNHKPVAVAEPELPLRARRGAGSRSAEAAARVAARYANAPSYSQMSEETQRANLRAARKANQSALDALAAVQSMLLEIEPAVETPTVQDVEPPVEIAVAAAFSMNEPVMNEAAMNHAAVDEPVMDVAVMDEVVEPVDAVDANPTLESLAGQPYGIRWATDLPERPTEPVAVRATHGRGVFEPRVEDWWKPAPVEDASVAEAIEVVEPDLPIHGNLIEFPRELVAARKARPRLAEGPLAKETGAATQLSIFEVDPGTVSMQPAAAESMTVTVAPEAPVWQGPEWSGIQLEAQPAEETVEPVRQAAEVAAERVLEIPDMQVGALELAPMNRRLMAAVVDCSLIAGVVLVAAAFALSKTSRLPGLHEIEFGAAAALAAMGLLYQMLSLAVGRRTPGMKYARIGLRTFDHQIPTSAQRLSRCGALVLSLLPVGLGVMWAVFDEGHLCWHDRLSRTYLRKN